MIDHVGFDVADLQKSRAFYLQALAPLGYGVVMEWEKWVGFGAEGKPDFWIVGNGKATTPHLHVAFRAKSRSDVDAFYTAALKAGASDNGAPGVREHYHPNYYGAFVIGPDGHNIEAVCHTPMDAPEYGL
jgi:catechol 2,3-dioxygenase-like lactoylglutathione lyase family enzyme